MCFGVDQSLRLRDIRLEGKQQMLLRVTLSLVSFT